MGIINKSMNILKLKPLGHFSGYGTKLWFSTWSFDHWIVHCNGLMKDDDHRQAISDLANWPPTARLTWSEAEAVQPKREQFVNLGKLSTANLIEDLDLRFLPNFDSGLMIGMPWMRTEFDVPSGSICKAKIQLKNLIPWGNFGLKRLKSLYSVQTFPILIDICH